MSQVHYFDWMDYDNDIHIGNNKKPKDYEYANNISRSEYFKKWYAKNKERHINNVRKNQAGASASK